jgi:hypothetical protein
LSESNRRVRENRSNPDLSWGPNDNLRSIAEIPVGVGLEIDTGLHRRPLSDFFLKGPIPLEELVAVGKMGGKTLITWLLIIHRTTFAKKLWVTLPRYALEEWGISNSAKIDALKRLEAAGKVAVSRPSGGYLKVRLVWKPRPKPGPA